MTENERRDAVVMPVDTDDFEDFRNGRSHGCGYLTSALTPSEPRKDLLIPVLPRCDRWNSYRGGLGVRCVKEVYTRFPKAGENGIAADVQDFSRDRAGSNAPIDGNQ
ncbi:hypothetical protein OG413_40545 [Streptomyces sp. NBC_01433]|uniref:hypothetical protein n=1 Tax=Streptomyces sp. NBC_01433 TaxID=2903864 RepID=UPI00224D423F|nr:hypothetical protein [Streptomyces sp. NBC_01433]MCX4681491.1 hypothetical protein [Streptomyces sp. NBC_01433]